MVKKKIKNKNEYIKKLEKEVERLRNMIVCVVAEKDKERRRTSKITGEY